MKRLLLSLLLLAAAFRADATDYTDLWYTPSESGWGVNLVQSDNFMFATFFIYGSNGSPIWYSAGLDRNATTGAFSGDLNTTFGTYFAVPWVPANFGGSKVGTATFTPSTTNAYQGTLTYTVTGVGTIIKQIERQTLTKVVLGGAYNGGQSGAYAGCTLASDNYAYIDRYDLTVTQLGNNSATFVFNYLSGLSCTLAGTIEQHGKQYRIPSATYTCTDGLNTTASMSEIKATSLGIEGRYFAPSVGGGCKESANFAAVLN